VKVLSASFMADTDRLRRFEQEARAEAGQRKPFKSVMLADATGLFDLPPSFSHDLKRCVYSYNRIASDLYIVEGLK
jgi:hypothetical protein